MPQVSSFGWIFSEKKISQESQGILSKVCYISVLTMQIKEVKVWFITNRLKTKSDWSMICEVTVLGDTNVPLSSYQMIHDVTPCLK